MGRALRRIPTWAWLATIVVGSTVVRAILARDLVAPFIMVDEIVWSELGRGIADTGEPLLRDEPELGYSIVYPLLISPVYAVTDGLVDAYAGVKTLNALIMSLAAVPAFFLARRVVRDGLALLAALMTIAIPSMAYTGTVMTENAFYPLFLLAALALVLVLERPTPLRVVVLLALVGLAFATRVQTVGDRGCGAPGPARARLVRGTEHRRDDRALPLAVRHRGGCGSRASSFSSSPQAACSARTAVHATARTTSSTHWSYLWWHVAELSLYVLVIPLAATIVLVARARSLDAKLQAFLAATVALIVCIIPVVATFASEFSGRIEERNMFYVAPLLCIALLAWIERDAPRPRVLAAIAAVISALLVVAVPFDRFITTSAITDTLMLLPFWSLQDRIGRDWIALAAFGLAAALAAAFLFVPRRYALALPLLVLGLWVLAIRPIWWGTHGFERFSRGVLFQGIRTADRDWIDTALPSGERAAFLWAGTERLTVNLSEFFNRGVGPVYYVTAPTPGGLPETPVRIDPRTGAVTLPDGEPVRDRFVLADSSFEPDGSRVSQDKGSGVTLWRVRTPLVSAMKIDGLYPNDSWSGREVTYLRRRCAPGRLAVSLSSDPSLFLEPQTIVARSNGVVVGRVRLRPEGRAVLSVPVTPELGTNECRVVYTVSPTAVPEEVTGGESDDDRELGAHFNRFVYRPTQ